MTERNNHNHNHIQSSPIHHPGWKYLLLLGTDIVGTVTFCLLNEHDLPNYWNELVTGSILQAAVEAIVHFNLSSTSLLDAVCLGGMPRWFSAAYAIFIGCRNTSVANVERQLHPFREEVRRRGSRNEDVTEDDLALEESFSSYVRRYSKKNGFVTELFGVLSIVYAVVKMLVRLYHEIRLEDYDDEDGDGDASQYHPIWWLGLLWFVIMSVFQLAWINGVCIAIVKGQALMAEGSETASVNNLGITSAVQSSTKRVTKHDDGFKASEGDRDDLRSPLLKSECSSGCTDETKSLTEKSDSESQVLESVKKCPEGATCETEYRAGWSDLLSLVRPDFVLMMTAFVFLLLAALTQILIPHYTGKILDSLAEYDDDFSSSGDDIWSVPGFAENIVKLVGAACLCGAFSGIRGAIFTVVGGRVNARIRTRLMDALLCQDIGFFDTTKSGDLSSRLCNDTTLVGDQVTLNINVFLRSFVQAVGVLIFMFLVSWQLTLLVFVSVPLITLSSKIYGKFMKRLTKLMQKRLADGNSISEAALSSMSTVRAFNAETSELEEYKKYMNRYLGLNLRAARAYVGYMTTITTLPLLITALVLFYGGLLVLSENNDDHISSGELVSFLLYLSSLTSAFNSMGNIFSSLTQAVGAADKVFEIMHRAPRSKRFRESSRSSASNAKRRVFTCSCLNKGLRPNMSTGDIKLNNVQMSYPARPSRQVLNGLTLSAPSGSVCALVGPSGGGKSSVISLIQNLYEQSAGTVTIDGCDVRELSHEWLSRNVAIVSQEPLLFARSIRQNIIYGLEGTFYEPSLESVKNAARLANASQFIEELPDGYETQVGERGVQLSGGQKQRIAIARALVRKPRILLLDEATSALDAESESSVQQAIDMMLKVGHGKGREGPSMTVIVVAHRLSTIRNADIIYVLSNGKVVEHGSHEELLTLHPNGTYSNLISKQIRAQKELAK